MEIVGIENTGNEAGIVHDTEVLHAGFEVGIGHGSRVLEFAQDGIVESDEVAVGDDGLERILTFVSDTMLRSGKPSKDIVFAVVFEVSIKMMALAEITFAGFLVNKDLALTIESESTNDVA